MEFRTLLLFLIILSTVCSCGQSQIDSSEINEDNGIIYKIGEKKPYTGVVIEKNEYGQIIDECPYNQGKKNGDRKRYRMNGRLLSKEYYKNDSPYGEKKYYHLDGTEAKLGEHLFGFMIGETFEDISKRYKLVNLYNQDDVDCKGEINWKHTKGAFALSQVAFNEFITQNDLPNELGVKGIYLYFSKDFEFNRTTGNRTKWEKGYNLPHNILYEIKMTFENEAYIDTFAEKITEKLGRKPDHSSFKVYGVGWYSKWWDTIVRWNKRDYKGLYVVTETIRKNSGCYSIIPALALSYRTIPMAMLAEQKRQRQDEENSAKEKSKRKTIVEQKEKIKGLKL